MRADADSALVCGREVNAPLFLLHLSLVHLITFSTSPTDEMLYINPIISSNEVYGILPLFSLRKIILKNVFLWGEVKEGLQDNFLIINLSKLKLVTIKF